MLRPRIIPCLLVHQGGLVKTVGFKDPKYVGDPINAVKIFNEKEADELIVVDMDATVNGVEPDYKAIEQRLEQAIHIRFGLPARTPADIRKLIKTADRACAYFEAVQLAGFGREESIALFGAPPPGYDIEIEPLAPAPAQAQYVERFQRLSEAAGFGPAAPSSAPG